MLQDALRRLRPADFDEGLVAGNAQKKMESVNWRSRQNLNDESPAEQKVIPKLDLWSHPTGFAAVVSLCSGARHGDAQHLGSEG